jgi:hypothetical protein
MNTERHRVRRFSLAAALLLLAGCHSTTLSTTWKEPSADTLSFNKVVVLVLNSSPAERRAQEDALVASIKRVNVHPSYPIIPEAWLEDISKVKQQIIDGGFDGALVLRLVDTRQETSYVPPTASSSWNGGSGWGYGPSYSTYHVYPGYSVTDTFVRSELSLYAVPSGKLLWSGASETTNPANARAFATDVIKAAAKELRRQGMLR